MKYTIQKNKHNCGIEIISLKSWSPFFFKSVSETLIATFLHYGPGGMFITEDKIFLSIILLPVVGSLILIVEELIMIRYFLSEIADKLSNLYHYCLKIVIMINFRTRTELSKFISLFALFVAVFTLWSNFYQNLTLHASTMATLSLKPLIKALVKW